jgi:hypothetical protein
MTPLILVTLGRENDPLKLSSRVISSSIVVQLCAENQFSSSGEAKSNAAGVFRSLGSWLRSQVVAATTDHVRSIGLVKSKQPYMVVRKLSVLRLNNDGNMSSFSIKLRCGEDKNNLGEKMAGRLGSGHDKCLASY